MWPKITHNLSPLKLSLQKVELGLAHALHKPVVLISSNEAGVPFDVRHVRVIYYELTDPFWGEKLIAKVAENVVSAIRNPIEAIQFQKE
jgi:hypothetical protein